MIRLWVDLEEKDANKILGWGRHLGMEDVIKQVKTLNELIQFVEQRYQELKYLFGEHEEFLKMLEGLRDKYARANE